MGIFRDEMFKNVEVDQNESANAETQQTRN